MRQGGRGEEPHEGNAHPPFQLHIGEALSAMQAQSSPQETFFQIAEFRKNITKQGIYENPALCLKRC